MPELNITPRTGFRRDSAREILLGPGAIILNYALPDERLLGATRGGCSFNPGVTFRDIEADKAYGQVRGLRVVEDIQPTITAQLLELGADNFHRAVPGMRIAETAGLQLVEGEEVGAGDDEQVVFELDNANVEYLRVFVDGDEVFDFIVRTPDHEDNSGTVDEIVFDEAPATADAITATYVHDDLDGTPKTHSRLRFAHIDDSDYLQNVALVGTALGYDEPFIGIIKNAVGQGGIELSLENRNEGVIEVTFAGMFTGAQLEQLTLGNTTLDAIAPFEMRWPLRTGAAAS